MSDGKEFVKVESGAGNFGECLVEGSAEEKKRGRKIRRRAIEISIALQSLGLTALVIAPMVAKPTEIRMASIMPIPPYNPLRPSPGHQRETISRPEPRPCVVCPTGPITPIKPSIMKEHLRIGDGNDKPDIEGFIPGGTDGLIRAFDSRTGPKRPDDTP